MTWAVEQDLKHTEKMVLIMLANYCNHQTGRCDPAHKRLAKECGMSVSTLKRSIDRLEALGLLTVENREVEGVSLPNQYHLHLEVSSERTPLAHKEPKVRPPRPDPSAHPDTGGGVQDELQTSKLNQEDKPGIEPLTGAGNPAPAGDGKAVSGVLLKQQQASDPETAFQTKCREAWGRYKAAYMQRYSVAPLRDAKVNSQVKQLVQRLGEEAGAVAEFFVLAVNDALIVKNCHELGYLLKGAMAYRTQWATGRAITSGQARQLDSTATNASAADEAIRMLREREGRQ